MANTTIKITQLPNIGNNLGVNTLLPVVDTTGTAITEKVSVGNVANYILNEAGNLLPIAGVAEIAYSVANAAQPNITSVGTLNVDTLHISGGLNGYFLQTDGNGNLSWSATGGGGNGSPGGANTQIQFNDAGSFGGNPSLTWDAGNVKLNAVNIGVSGNLAANNFSVNSFTTNNFTATGNVTANYFIGNGSLLTGIVASASAGGPNTAVQFNNNGSVSGEGNFTYDNGNHILNVTRANVSYLTAYESIDGGNLVFANNIQANYLSGDGSNITNISNVANANYSNYSNVANLANSVAVANVVGIGNIATLSLDGNSSNVLYGNGVFSSVPNTANANYANFAGEAYSVDGANVNGEVANANYAMHVDVEPTTNNYSYHVVLVQNPGDNHLQLDGDDQLQYNPNQGILTTYRLDADITVANLYYSNGYQASNVVGLGNVAYANFDGNSSNVLYGNGVFSGMPLYPNTVIWTTAPNSNTATGSAGQAAYDAGGNLYVCVATDSWAKFIGTTNW